MLYKGGMMNNFYLLFDLIKSTAIVAVAAELLLSETNLFPQLIKRRTNPKSKFFLIIFFGLLSLSGTYLGVYVHGAYANIRAIGAVVGGLLGGPLIGVGAGLIGGLHRYSLGGFTATACAISTILAGLLGGAVYLYRPFNKISLMTSFLLAAIIEVIEMTIVLYFSYPYAQAYELVRIIALPMIFTNALGITLFINILKNSLKRGEGLMALQSYKTLKIANQSLTHMKNGLNYTSALKTAQMILDITEVAAVSITDREKILAHCGLEKDHHQSGKEILTKATMDALTKGKLVVINNKEDIGCPAKDCSLNAAVIAPLNKKKEVIGLLKLYKSKAARITDVDIELARGISELLSTQLHMSSLEKQAQLTTKAELKALRAQVNPHFLFNALNTIISFCRTSPNMAKELLIKLSKFFRQSLKENKEIISLFKEIEYTSNYIEIEKARFGPNLKINLDIPSQLLDYQVPSFVLQPIVENSIKHGVSSKPGVGIVAVKVITRGKYLMIEVEDNGIGMADEYLNYVSEVGYGDGCGIGLSNVKQRIQKMYGTEYGLEVESQKNQGTIVRIKLPLKGVGQGEED